MLVDSRLRSTGLGRELLKKAMEIIETDWKAERIKIGAQAYLIDFYQSAGFEPVSEIYLEDGIEHVEMIARLGN